MRLAKPFSYSVLILILVFVATGYMLVNRQVTPAVDKQTTTTEPTDVSQTKAESQSAVNFYLALDPNNPVAWEHDNSEIVDFESCNSLGVDENLARDFPELLPDFVFIGDQIAAREQFLQDQNFVFDHPEHFYKTLIAACRDVNGAMRIQSIVLIGHDGINPAIGVGGGPFFGKLTEVSLSEIWRVDPDGGAPRLLERIRKGDHDGFYWHHEDLLTTAEHPPRPTSTTMGGH